jgi:hypothetical protein
VSPPAPLTQGLLPTFMAILSYPLNRIYTALYPGMIYTSHYLLLPPIPSSLARTEGKLTNRYLCCYFLAKQPLTDMSMQSNNTNNPPCLTRTFIASDQLSHFCGTYMFTTDAIVARAKLFGTVVKSPIAMRSQEERKSEFMPVYELFCYSIYLYCSN